MNRLTIYCAVVVGLCIGVLSLAGNRPLGIGRPVEDSSRVQLDQRIFSCTGGIAGATVRSGSLAAGPDPVRVVPTAPTSPISIVADKAAAPGAFAGQQASSKRSLAWVPCPEPQARWWFVAAGGAAVTHDTVLTLSNPRPGVASVDINVYGPQGLVRSPDLRDIQVPPSTSRLIDLAKLAPAVGNLAVSVTATRGLIAVTAADHFSPGSLGKAVDEWLPPQPLPSTSIDLVGMPTQRGASTMYVANPGGIDAIVKVEVIGTTGTYAPAALRTFIVGPRSVRSVPLVSVIDGTPLALHVSSPQRVTATVRSVKNGDTSFATGVGVVRGGTSFGVPDGSAQLVFSSLRTGATIQLHAFGVHGNRLAEKTIKVSPRTSLALQLPAGTTYVNLVADRPDVVVGLSVIGAHGTASAGVSSAIRWVQLPKVRLGW